jgi:hypothetical protein
LSYCLCNFPCLVSRENGIDAIDVAEGGGFSAVEERTGGMGEDFGLEEFEHDAAVLLIGPYYPTLSLTGIKKAER